MRCTEGTARLDMGDPATMGTRRAHDGESSEPVGDAGDRGGDQLRDLLPMTLRRCEITPGTISMLTERPAGERVAKSDGSFLLGFAWPRVNFWRRAARLQ